jgi:hypothetical protein
MKFALLFAFLTVVPVSVHAQCTQKFSDLPAAPELFGFHLGMTKEQVKTLVPQIHFGKNDDFGVSKTTINPGFDPKMDAAKFADVRSISLELLDERLTSIWVGFEETYKIQDIAAFATSISKSFGLPNAWSAYRGRGQQMRCADFQLMATTVARAPTLRIVDLSADDTIAARRQTKEEQDAAAEVAAENGENTSVIADKKTKTYYPSTCDAAKEISIDNRLIFKTAAEAEKAGFKSGKGC